MGTLATYLSCLALLLAASGSPPPYRRFLVGQVAWFAALLAWDYAFWWDWIDIFTYARIRREWNQFFMAGLACWLAWRVRSLHRAW